jgi:hypothetical protein
LKLGEKQKLLVNSFKKRSTIDAAGSKDKSTVRVQVCETDESDADSRKLAWKELNDDVRGSGKGDSQTYVAH